MFAADFLYWPGFDTHRIFATCWRPVISAVHLTCVSKSHCTLIPCRLGHGQRSAPIFLFDGSVYVVSVDYCGTYVIVFPLTETQSSDIFEAFQTQFATFGIPDVLFTGNRTQFSSHRFCQFASDWFFLRMTCGPGYPQSNGQTTVAQGPCRWPG